MLKMLYQTSVIVDRILATEQQRMVARECLRYAVARHGTDAYRVLHHKLRDDRRNKSRRSIRLAIATLVSETP